jgi:RNA polymerase sigma-70 factor (ECF subfamily)
MPAVTTTRETPPREAESPERSDRSLLVRFRDGEQDAATALYLRYAKRLQSLARKQTAADLAQRFDPEDVVQSVFRTFFRRVVQGHYDIPAGDELWRLFLVISLNKIRDLAAYHRAAKRDVATTVRESNGASAKATASDTEALGALQMVIDEILAGLPEVQRRMVELRIEGHDIAAIAAQTQRSKRTVERVLQQFRDQLQRMLSDDCD